ncbi:MAG: S-methyl-5-thioribose-1-phosphate isomerase [Planctomycetes bacterium]|nr:S-methyl-5-thioribose-1-phosphate isomerase [Planctomycetota bacterium]MCB9888576.1 S-methyl-5-thioribose-1-phosphate isomerase [Planctomycetota bacterium]
MRPPIAWVGEAADGHLELLDQTLLPAQEVVLELRDIGGVIDAIQRLAVRGAPAIGVAAGYGVVLGVRHAGACDPAELIRTLGAVCDELGAARPTAVNLQWAVQRMRERGKREPDLAALLDEAHAIHQQDAALCLQIGAHGAALVRDGMTVLTHCNAGRLATAGDGTALAVLYAAWATGTRFRVLADETRPLLQGARLTALELHDAGIPVEVIADSAAAGLIARGAVDLVITGADRIARNGDAANKVGTYAVALAAAAHGVPMYIAAPFSTFDLELDDGSAIPIEDRDPDEVLGFGGMRIAPPGVGARNPAFDITPGRLLAGLITDRGVIAPVDEEGVVRMLG